MCFRPPQVQRMVKKCTNCGTENPVTATVCSQCGTKLPDTPTPAASPARGPATPPKPPTAPTPPKP
jgi:hypothetical protein